MDEIPAHIKIIAGKSRFSPVLPQHNGTKSEIPDTGQHQHEDGRINHWSLFFTFVNTVLPPIRYHIRKTGQVSFQKFVKRQGYSVTTSEHAQQNKKIGYLVWSQL